MGVSEAEERRKEEVARRDFGAMFETFQEGILLGTAAKVAERIHAYAEAGAEQVNVVLRAPFDWEAFDAFLQEVVPLFRRG
jgi:alkanesulfonate monooxygenase SsuD/methylene tetrahydromethanopterin reductase-like flavin-dependent oxidoreductase (luciferase family)